MSRDTIASTAGLPLGAPDEQLVESALAGDRLAFESLVRRHQRPLVNHIYRHTGQRDCAVDLAQEVFLKVYLSLASFDPRYRFTTWLYRIASNCAIDHLRRRSAEHKLFEASELDADSFESPGPSPLQVGLRSELRQQIIDAIDAQPERYRAPLVLRFYAELDYDTIARLLDVSRNQVATLLFRGRRRLRESLEGRGTIS